MLPPYVTNNSTSVPSEGLLDAHNSLRILPPTWSSSELRKNKCKASTCEVLKLIC
jgi:hypothetical protein